MNCISPVKIDQVPRKRPGRPKQERILELENLVNLAVISGRVSIDAPLLGDEEGNPALFRSRARAAGKRAGRTVRASVRDGVGTMVITSDSEDEEDGE